LGNTVFIVDAASPSTRQSPVPQPDQGQMMMMMMMMMMNGGPAGPKGWDGSGWCASLVGLLQWYTADPATSFRPGHKQASLDVHQLHLQNHVIIIIAQPNNERNCNAYGASSVGRPAPAPHQHVAMKE